MKILIPGAALLLAGCQTYVPVATDKAPAPPECKRRPHNDLPAVPKLEGETVTPDALNKHWARHYRLEARPRYRSLREAYRICSTYAVKK
jgi:hypothetical protein